MNFWDYPNYMINKGWYHAYDVSEQIQLDMKNAETALSIAD
jgi:similar to spore coat protein